MQKLFILLVMLTILQINCSDLIVQPPKSNQNIKDFEIAWKAVDNVYPLLDYKKIDWDSIYAVYHLRTENAKGDEFYQVLFDLLRELKDPHVFLLSKGHGLILPYQSPRYKRGINAYSPFVVRKYFNCQLQLSCKDKVEYGIHSDNIGYVCIASFNDEGTMDNFDAVLDQLLDTKGLIIDVRRNVGGSTANIEKVVSRFIQSPLKYMKGFTKGNVPFNKNPIQPNTARPRYMNQVIVLINGTTISAGELFAEFMNQIPTVTILGDTTAGAACNDIAENIEGDYSLPSGKQIHVGTTYACRYDGLPIDWNGIPPEIRVVQTEVDMKNNKDRQLEYAIELLR
jgi:carboxyl-terminal processing protease